jgi:YrbI family 3-deoxy-D-manno-octulosonate 8-phosphate phosphatase
MNRELVARLQHLRLIAFDFDGVFTDNAVWVFEDGREAIRCTRADGIGLAQLKAAGVEVAIISTETNPVVGARAGKLAIRCIQSCENKQEAVTSLADGLGIALKDVAFVGNDVNDLPACNVVGVAIAVADAHPDMARHAHWQTRAAGGHGAVREICDLVVRARADLGSMVS